MGPPKKSIKVVTPTKEQAEILNQQFVTVFSDTTPPTTYHERILNAKMNEIMIDVDGVHKQLVTLTVNKAAGPDGISPKVLKELADVLAKPLITVCQNSRLRYSHR